MFFKKAKATATESTKNDLGNDFIEKRGARIFEMTAEHIISQESKTAELKNILKRMETDGTSGTEQQKQINSIMELVNEFEALDKNFKAKDTALKDNFNKVLEKREEHYKPNNKTKPKPSLSEVRQRVTERQTREQALNISAQRNSKEKTEQAKPEQVKNNEGNPER